MITLSHPTGNEFVRSALTALHARGALEGFHTSVACFEGTALWQAGRLGPLGELRRRSYPPEIAHLTHTHPAREIGRIASAKLGARFLTRHETGPFSVDAVYHALDRAVAESLSRSRGAGRAVYAYEDGADLTFAAARGEGFACLYDLPIGYWRAARRILGAECERSPAWASTMPGLGDSAAKVERKDREIANADAVFVASTFTAATLVEYPGEIARVVTVPYGFPPVAEARDYDLAPGTRPLRILFVGGLSQRKGIAQLFDAVERLGSHVELTVVGRRVETGNRALDTRLARHRYIESLPHTGVLALMREHDVLAFPSLFEGFGMVITEAMSQGTPVITTDRTAGPDIIRHGVDGWIVEAGESEPIVEVLEGLLADRRRVGEVGAAARETAAQRPWRTYGEELAAAACALAAAPQNVPNA